MLPCLYKNLFNLECPGCGFQRSLFFLLKGDVSASLSMYWATIPILLMFLYCLIHLRFRFSSGPRHLIFLYSFNGLLVICQYIYNLTQHL